MSRIGNKPINIPSGVEVKINGDIVQVKGPKGSLELKIHPAVKLEAADGVLRFTRSSNDRFHKAIHGTMRALVNNMIIGVTNGFEKTLVISGVGYQAKIEKNQLVLRIGYTKPVRKEIPANLEVTCPKETVINIRGIDKQLVGQFAAEVRKIRPVNPYTLKGIKYIDEVVVKKAGKAAVGATK